jgi:hypothetical protein
VGIVPFLIFFIGGKIETVAVGAWKRVTVARLHIVLSRRRASDRPAALRSVHGPFWRIKAILATVVAAAVFIGLLLAALFLGSVIAAVLVILVSVVIAVAALKAFLGYLRNT